MKPYSIKRRLIAGVLLVEFEIAYGERPFSFPNTYQAVRDSVEELNRAVTLTELYDTAARAVRDLTGFDRVMVYRYDEDYNGEVVAEDRPLVEADLLYNRWLLLRKGKRNYHLLDAATS